MCWQSKRLHWKGCLGGEQRGKGNQESYSVLWLAVVGFSDGNSFRVVFGQSFWLKVLPGSTHIAQPRWMPARRILGGGQTGGVSLWPFLNASGWWYLKGDLVRWPWVGSTGGHAKPVMLSTCRPWSQANDHSWLLAFLWQCAWGLIALSTVNSAI